MTYSFRLVLALLCASPLEVVAQSCNEPETRNACLATCDVECGSEEFLKDNISYCYDASQRRSPIDSQACPLASESVSSCADAEDVFACVAAGQNLGTPSCSEKAVDLITVSGAISKNIERTLEPYLDIIDTDWTSVENRTALCNKFTPENLAGSFVKASGSKSELDVFVSEVSRLRSCRDDWIEWEEGAQQQRLERSLVPDDTGSVDQLLQELQDTFEPLDNNLAKVSVALTKLEQAVPRIESTIGTYARWCE